MAASDEATPTSGSKQANSLKHMGGGADESNSGKSQPSQSPQSIVANEEQANGVQQTATTTTTTSSSTTTQYDVEHLATFSTTSSHETSALGGTNDDDDHDDDATKATIARDESTTTTTSVATREPRVALQRLFELEKLSGIWTQRMQIELRSNLMLILDCETNSIVERFSRERITKPESFSQYNDIYNNIIVFLIEPERQQVVGGIKESTSATFTASATSQQKKQRFKKSQEDCASSTDTPGGELHIFQCVSHQAQQLVNDIIAWKSGAGDECSLSHQEETTQANQQQSSLQETKDQNHSAAAADMNKSAPISQPETGGGGAKPLVAIASAAAASSSSSPPGEIVPIVNVNVKETVQVFNQIAALREKGASNQVVARPLSTSEVTANSSDNSTRAAAEPVAFYKQRSIRAILAPKLQEQSATEQPKGEASSSSMASETSTHESNGGKPATSTSSSTSASSAADGNNQQNKRAAASSKLPPPSSNHKTSNGIKTTTTTSSNNNNQQAASKLHNKEGNSNGNGNSKTAKQSTSASSSSTCSSGAAAARAHNNNSNNNNSKQQQQHSSQQSDSSRGSHASPSSQLEQVTTNESYVSVLNHCFDDIEKFIIRLQQAYTAVRELQAKRRQSKRSNHQLALAAAAAAAAAAASATSSQQQQQNGNKSQAPPPTLTASELALLSARARGPTTDDFFEILSKFKLAFNLLAKLKGCIHEPNAPELVHFLFTPLAIIIESARNVSPPVDPTVVGIPYLNKEALDLLSNCCTSKESDLWLSLGPNWTQTIDIQVLKASRLPSSFQPIFSDGWAPVIGELELIGLVPPPVHELDQHYRSSRAICAAPPPGAAADMPDPSETSLNAPGRHNASRAYKNGTSEHQHNITKHKRGSPTGNGLARNHQHYLDPRNKSQLSPTPYGYQQQRDAYIAADLNNHGDHHMLDHQYGGRAARLPPPPPPATSNGHHHRSARHSLPHQEQHLVVSKSKSSSNNRRNSDYPGGYAAGHFSQPPTSYGGFDDAGYPLTDGYAELQEDYRHQQQQHSQHQLAVAAAAGRRARDLNGRGVDYLPPMYDNAANGGGGGGVAALPPHSTSSSNRLTSSYDDHSAYLPQSLPPPPPPGAPGSFYIDEAEREAMLLDLGPIQTEWFYELTARNALIVRVLFSREANNDKELTVKRGEVLEILDDSRKWWKARNIELQVAYVPHTIVAVMEHYQTLDELLTNSPCDMMMMTVGADDSVPALNSQRFSRRQLQANNDGNFNHHQNGNHGFKEARRNAKTAGGAFRYF